MEGRRLRLKTVDGSMPTARPFRVIARQQLRVGARVRYADPIVLTRHWREIHDDEHVLITVAAEERDHGVVAIGDVDPLKSLPTLIGAPQRRLLSIDMRQPRDELTERGTSRIVAQQVPIET